MKKLIFSLLVLCLFIPGPALAGGRDVLSISGTLLGLDDLPITDTLRMAFRLYDEGASGDPVWEETQTVAVEEGLYNVELGNVTALSSELFDADSLFLGIQIGDDSEMTPRLTMNSVPWAQQAEVALVAQTLMDGSVTASAIAPDAVGATQIGVGEVGSSELASTGVTAGTYTLATVVVDADGRITAAASGTSGTGTITGVAAGTGLTGGGTSGTITLGIAAGGVGNTELADGSVTTAKIGAGAVGASELAATTVTAGSYTVASITIDADGRLTSASSGTAQSLISGRSSKSITASTTCHPYGGDCDSANASLGTHIPFAATLKNLNFYMSAAQAGGDTCVLTLRKATGCTGVFSDTTLTCSITGAQTCADTANTVAVTANDCINITFTESDGTCSGFLSWSMEMTAP